MQSKQDYIDGFRDRTSKKVQASHAKVSVEAEKLSADREKKLMADAEKGAAGYLKKAEGIDAKGEAKGQKDAAPKKTALAQSDSFNLEAVDQQS